MRTLRISGEFKSQRLLVSVILFLLTTLVATEATLVGYWSFDSAVSSLTPTLSGRCQSPIAASVPLSGGAAISTTTFKVGTGALNLGFTSRIDTGIWSVDSPNSQISFAAWMRTGSANGNADIVYKRNTFEFYYNSNDIVCALYFNSQSSVTVTVSNTVSNNVWVHAVCSYDNAKLCVYINGGTPTCKNSNNVISEKLANVYIGNNANGFQNFNGYIDELRIFDHALSTSEISKLYAAVNPNDAPRVTISLDPSSTTAILEGDSLKAAALDPLRIVTNYTDSFQAFNGVAGPGTPTYKWTSLSSDCGVVQFQSSNASATDVKLSNLGDAQVSVCVTDGELAGSDSVRVTVSASQPLIVQEPSSNVTLYLGQSTTLRVVASGVPPPTYQWQDQEDVVNTTSKRYLDWVDIAGETLDSLVIDGTSANDGRLVRCLVRSAGGLAISDEVAISVQSVTSGSSGGGDGTIIVGDGGSDFPAGAIAGIVVGAALLCCFMFLIALVILAVLIRRKRSPYRKLKQPDYEELAFGDAKDLHYDLSKKQERRFDDLERLLLASDMRLVQAICSSCNTGNLDKSVKALTRVYGAHGRALELLQGRISFEVEEADDEGTLFRANSAAAKMFGSYIRMAGLKYLWHVLVLPVNTLNDNAIENFDDPAGSSSHSSIRSSRSTVGGRYRMDADEELGSRSMNILGVSSMEVDPHKLDDASDATINTLELWLVAQKMFKSIVNSERHIPVEVRRIMKHLHDEVGNKFTEIAQFRAIGGFYFLRLICPALLAPHIYGLLDEPAHQTAQRQLILVSKVLQNLANDTLPGSKEEYMEKLNNFIVSNKETLNSFYLEVVNNAERGRPGEMSVPHDAKTNALVELHGLIVANLDPIKNFLGDDDHVVSELQQVLAKLGKPLVE